MALLSKLNNKRIDDLGFLKALIADLSHNYNIDQSRIYATGISNGAHMSEQLALKMSDQIAAVALVGYSMLKTVSQTPHPANPVSVLIMTGTKDPLVPWQGGERTFFGGRKIGTTITVPETIGYWVAANKCSSIPMVSDELDNNPQDGTRIRKEVYGNGKTGTEVVLYAIEDGGHTWPGGKQYLPERLIGKTSRDLDANEIIWSFFKRHVRK